MEFAAFFILRRNLTVFKNWDAVVIMLLLLLFDSLVGEDGININGLNGGVSSPSSSIAGLVGVTLCGTCLKANERSVDEKEMILEADCKIFGATYESPAPNETPAMRNVRRSKIGKILKRKKTKYSRKETRKQGE